MITEYYDPCQEAANKSIKCLHRNRGDKSMCADYFQYVERNEGSGKRDDANQGTEHTGTVKRHGYVHALRQAKCFAADNANGYYR